MTKAEIDWLDSTVHMKDQVLGNVFGWTFSNRIFHCIHIVWTSCSQLPAWSEIFCLLVEVVYWACGLKFVYPTINLAFLGIIVQVKSSVKFCLHSLEWFCLQISSDAKYFFLSCPRHCDQGLIVVYSILFSNLKQKKEHISRVISSHMCPMYIETPLSLSLCMCDIYI